MHLLDTNILSHLIRFPAGAAAQRIASLDADQVVTSIIVAAELRYGAARRPVPERDRRIEILLTKLPVLPWSEPCDRVYARLRADMESTGQLIGANDLLIAAHATALGHVLVTDNVREFARVPGLAVENWLR